MRQKVKFAAYYYPGWNQSVGRKIRSGNSEWGLLYDSVAHSAFPDIRRPITGPLEPTTENIEADVRMANGAGVDAFLWCWYWDQGLLYFNDSLEMFLAGNLPDEFQYALMWANRHPHYNLPHEHVPTRFSFRSRRILTNEKDFEALIKHLINNHWWRQSYLTVDSRPLLLIYDVATLIQSLGATRLERLLGMGNRIARAAGFNGVQYVAITHRLDRPLSWLSQFGLGRVLGEASLADIGFRATSTYMNLPEWGGPSRQDYASLIDKRVADWPKYAAKFALPFWPSVSPGWDARPRGIPLKNPKVGYPWTPVVTDATPALFSSLLDNWRLFAAQANDIPILPIVSWNEWSEGHAIAPCNRYGSALLNAVKKLKSELKFSVDTQ